MWWEGTPYSHIAVAIYEPVRFILDGKALDFPNGCIIHADDPGVVPISFEEFFKTRKAIARKTVELHTNASGFQGYCQRAIGKGLYSDGQLIAIGARVKVLRPLFSNGRAKSICSELGGDILVDLAGVKLKGDPDFDWTPKYLFGVLEPEPVS